MKFTKPSMEIVLDLSDLEVLMLNISTGDPNDNPDNDIIWGDL